DLSSDVCSSDLTAVLFWLLGIISFNWFPLDLSLLVLPNYMSYFHGVNSFGNTWVPFLIESIVIIFLLLLSTIFDKKIKIKLDINLKYIIYFVLVLLCLFSGFQRSSFNSIEYGFISIFFGTSTEETTFLSILTYIVIYYGFTYLMQLFLNKEINNLRYYKISRYNSINEWIIKIFQKVMISIVILLIGLFIFTLVLALFLGQGASDSSIDTIPV